MSTQIMSEKIYIITYSSAFLLSVAMEKNPLIGNIAGVYGALFIFLVVGLLSRVLFRKPGKPGPSTVVPEDTDDVYDKIKKYLRGKYIEHVFQGVYSMNTYGNRLSYELFRNVNILKFLKRDSEISPVWMLKMFTNSYLLIFFVLFSLGYFFPPDYSTDCNGFSTTETCAAAAVRVSFIASRGCEWVDSKRTVNCIPAHFQYDAFVTVQVAAVAAICLSLVSVFLEPVFQLLAISSTHNYFAGLLRPSPPPNIII